MPKSALHSLSWDEISLAYLWREPDKPAQVIPADDVTALSTRISGLTGFAFEGSHGHLSVLREARPNGGAGYWYAYRRQGRRTRKKYLGATAALTLARLEEAAAALGGKGTSMVEPGKHMGGQGEQMREQGEQMREQGEHKASPLQTENEMAHPVPDPSPPPLLMPKLQPPRLPASLITRERLLQRMDEGLAHPVMVLAAPAGYGKTTLARQWLAERGEQPGFPAVGWMALDGAENDPVRFWRYVMAACEAFAPGCSQEADMLLIARNRFRPVPLETALTVFINALTQAGGKGLLVLEDLHLITAAETQQSITFFLEHLPPTMHVLILARGTLPFFATRMISGDAYWGIFPPEMCFTLEETRTFLEQIGKTPMSDELVAHVHAQTQGWPAGMRILSIALQRRMPQDELAQFLANFAGNQRSVVDYFVTEVLNHQPEEMQDFLLRTSVLPRMTGTLCDAALNRAGSQRALETLFAADIFLEPLYGTGEWYRYHALFADAMRQEALRRLGSDTLRDVNQRASRWYAQQGLMPEAIDASLRAGLMVDAVGLIQQLFGQQPFLIGAAHPIEFHTFCRWMEQIPEGVLQRYPELCLTYASVLLVLMQTRERSTATLRFIEGLLQVAEDAWERAGNVAKRGEALALHAMLANDRGMQAQGLDYARRALVDLAPEEATWRSCCLTVLGSQETVHGDLWKSRGLLVEAQQLSARIGNVGFTRANTGMLSALLAEQGELHQAAANFRQMLAEARAQGDRDDICRAQLCLAGILYEWNLLDDAWKSASEALALAEDFANDELRVYASVTLARAEFSRGKRDAAQARLAALLTWVQPLASPLHQQLQRTAFAWQVHLALRSGDLAPALRWLAAREPDALPVAVPLRYLEAGNEAQVLMAQGEGSAACELLAPLLTHA